MRSATLRVDSPGASWPSLPVGALSVTVASRATARIAIQVVCIVIIVRTSAGLKGDKSLNAVATSWCCRVL